FSNLILQFAIIKKKTENLFTIFGLLFILVVYNLNKVNSININEV
ncbi:hypothetical protein HMPREF9498_01987, partial [Enterococcus faecalis TX4248]